MGKEPLTCNSDHAHNWSLPKAVLCPPMQDELTLPQGLFPFLSLCTLTGTLHLEKDHGSHLTMV